MKPVISILILSGMLLFGCWSRVATAQSANLPPAATAPEIRWVGQYPADRYTAAEKGFFRKMANLLAGKQPPGLVNPMAVQAHDSTRFWVLDRKTNALIAVKKGKGEKVKMKPPDGAFATLIDFCLAPGRGIWMTDASQGVLYFLPAGSKRLRTIATDLQQPTGLVWLPRQQALWLVETGAHRLVMFNGRGDTLKTIGGRGNGPGQFNYPTHIWADRNGMVYVTDAMNFRIQIFSSAGVYLGQFGEAGDASGYFARPKGVATDSHGNIYVVDGLFHNVQVFDRQGQLLYHFGRQGREAGEFWLPTGIYIDDNDYIYIADSFNARVQIFKLRINE